MSGDARPFVVLIKAQRNDKKDKEYYLKPPGWPIIRRKLVFTIIFSTVNKLFRY